MQLTLTAEQRLNLTVVLGAAECTTVAELRAVWRLLDELALDTAEKEMIELQTQNFQGREVYIWNREKTVPPREYELSEPDAGRIQKALEAGARFPAGAVRAWLEPLLAQLPGPAAENGAAAAGDRMPGKPPHVATNSVAD